MGSSQGNIEESGPEVHDPLAGMSEIDKWGLKGFSFMMNNFSDYAALVAGSDTTNLGFDLNSEQSVL
jgi:CCR4-NOT transcription complex subunit 2